MKSTNEIKETEKLLKIKTKTKQTNKHTNQQEGNWKHHNEYN